mmetsp:Transcript_15366/g.39184  ORF Transcript_15366/g.39184 Transcript_15366/m.39184 type:complete len:473 (-) Transcript_15366:610-2028(-)
MLIMSSSFVSVEYASIVVHSVKMLACIKNTDRMEATNSFCRRAPCARRSVRERWYMNTVSMARAKSTDMRMVKPRPHSHRRSWHTKLSSGTWWKKTSDAAFMRMPRMRDMLVMTTDALMLDRRISSPTTASSTHTPMTTSDMIKEMRYSSPACWSAAVGSSNPSPSHSSGPRMSLSTKSCSLGDSGENPSDSARCCASSEISVHRTIRAKAKFLVQGPLLLNRRYVKPIIGYPPRITVRSARFASSNRAWSMAMSTDARLGVATSPVLSRMGANEPPNSRTSENDEYPSAYGRCCVSAYTERLPATRTTSFTGRSEKLVTGPIASRKSCDATDRADVKISVEPDESDRTISEMGAAGRTSLRSGLSSIITASFHLLTFPRKMLAKMSRDRISWPSTASTSGRLNSTTTGPARKGRRTTSGWASASATEMGESLPAKSVSPANNICLPSLDPVAWYDTDATLFWKPYAKNQSE